MLEDECWFRHIGLVFVRLFWFSILCVFLSSDHFVLVLSAFIMAALRL